MSPKSSNIRSRDVGFDYYAKSRHDFSPRMIKLCHSHSILPHADFEEAPIPESIKNSIAIPSEFWNDEAIMKELNLNSNWRLILLFISIDPNSFCKPKLEYSECESSSSKNSIIGIVSSDSREVTTIKVKKVKF